MSASKLLNSTTSAFCAKCDFLKELSRGPILSQVYISNVDKGFFRIA